MKFSIVTTTCKNAREAGKISDLLLDKKLAACVKLSSVKSSYVWNGKKRKSSETMLTILTTKRNASRAMSAIKKMHSYKVPEIIEFDVRKGNKSYLEWVDDVTE